MGASTLTIHCDDAMSFWCPDRDKLVSEQPFLGDFPPWEREYDPSLVISTPHSSIQPSHIQIACSLSTDLPPTLAPMTTSLISVSNHTWSAPNYFMLPGNQPTTSPYIFNSSHRVIPTSITEATSENHLVSSSPSLQQLISASQIAQIQTTTKPTIHESTHFKIQIKSTNSSCEAKVFDEMSQSGTATSKVHDSPWSTHSCDQLSGVPVIQDYGIPFSGSDPCRFIQGYEEFFKVNPMTEVDMIQYVMQDFVGEALEWYYQYVEGKFSDTWTPDCWEDFVTELYRKFAGEHHVFVERSETEMVKVSESKFVGNEPSEVVHNLFARMPEPVTNREQQILREKFVEDEEILPKINCEFNFLQTMVEYVNLHQVLRCDFDLWNYMLSNGLNFGFDPGDLPKWVKFLWSNPHILINISQYGFNNSKCIVRSYGIKFLDYYCLCGFNTIETDVAIGIDQGLQVQGHVNKYGLGYKVYIHNTLVHFHIHFGIFENAPKLLDKVSGRNVSSANVIWPLCVGMSLIKLMRTWLTMESTIKDTTDVLRQFMCLVVHLLIHILIIMSAKDNGDDERLKSQDGVLVVFSEVRGMTKLNDGKPRKVINARPSSFSLEEDTSNFGPYGRGYIVTQMKQPNILNFKPLNNRYDAHILVFKAKLKKKLEDVQVLVVGSGTLDCEFLKNFALMTVACNNQRKLTVTDDDVIEKSNLSRQFLFHDWNIGQAKSTVTATTAALINPSLRIEALQNRVGPETENIFDDTFWDNLSVVVNALGNVNVKMYVDQRCLYFQKPLLESGTLGAKCNTQMVIPHLTENYSASRDPPEKQAPICTMHSFPHNINHCLTWVRPEFEGLLEKTPAEVNAYLSNPSEYTSAMVNAGDAHARDNLEHVLKCLDKDRCETFQDCITWARLRFEDYFSNRVKQLIFTFSKDAATSTGAPFRLAPKRFPLPLQHPKTLAEAVDKVMVPEFQPKKGVKIETDEKSSSLSNAFVDDSAVINELIIKLEQCWKILPFGFRMKPIQFEKDDDTNYHMDIIAALANMRARNYSIPEVDKLKTKLIAGILRASKLGDGSENQP